ncbi:MAG: hypothetical protein B6241_09210 [Spirochaetaceae bacterium 4572_59]|nr:MAG: hypothetical protein B6241_09210 [Spirochaetaceae bacterium 4572_59]
MRKYLTIFLFISLISASLYSEDKDIPQINLSTEDLEGRAKAGLALGYPFGLTFGYKLANYMEVNVFAGSHLNDFSLGTNLLFTVVDINIKEEMFPFSIGPAVYFNIDDDFNMAIAATVRGEYNFNEIPLNLYVEITPGFSFINDFDFYIASSLGIRYVF